MQITIELPNDFVAFKAVPEIKQEIKTSYALWFVSARARHTRQQCRTGRR